MRASSRAEATLVAADRPLPSATRREEGGLPCGGMVGRYVVLSRLGAGGMGVVYAAYDPELDRKVALKVLWPAVVDRRSDDAARLLREARALGQLNHPNVVAVHDIGTHEGDVWLAMEFVAGRTLSAWLRERARPWREVLDVIRPVALGLAAAHQAGLVHRDVKPDNVMLGDDGRVRVMDFGLARGTMNEVSEEGRSDSGVGRRRLDDALTHGGASPGTPAYMAPEQHACAPTDARTDQFSLCVLLWEAVYGRRPFDGQSRAELATNVVEGRRCPPPRGVSVPKWLRAVMHRGLAVEPDARWPSLKALLHALDRGRGRARVAKIVAGSGLVVLAGACAVGMRHLDQQRGIAACERAGAEIEAVWNDDERAAVRAGLLATRTAHAAATADRVVPWLDEYTAAWRAVRTDACFDAGVDERSEAETVERSTWCLDERRFDLAALVGELKRADVESVTRAVTAAAALREVDPCRDPILLSSRPAPPAESRERVRAVRADLARVDALEATAAYEEGLRAARATLEQAEAIAWPPLTAAARVRVGSLLERTGAYAEAETVQEQAYFEAARAGALEEALSAARTLGFTVGSRLARPIDGEKWSRHADVLRSALPDPAGLREAASLSDLARARRLMGAYAEAATLYERAVTMRERALGPEHPDVAQTLDNLALVRQSTGAYEDAASLHERALAIWEHALGPEHPLVAESLSNLGNVRHATGAYEDAASLHERALAIKEHALGPEHPVVAETLNNLALVHEATGAYEDAAALHERALAIWEHALGREHPNVAASLNNLANVREASGAYAEAARLHGRALAIREQALGPTHPAVAQSLNNLANVRADTGAHEEAASLHERALAIREQALGAEHPAVAQSRENLADSLRVRGAHEEAEAQYQRARAIREKAFGPDHPHVAYAIVGLARVRLAQDRPSDAVPLAERAVELRRAADVSAVERAEADLVLAQALVAADASDPRPVSLARAARDAYRDAGEAHRSALAEADAFLREHVDRR